jgi:hypothetical protein
MRSTPAMSSAARASMRPGEPRNIGHRRRAAKRSPGKRTSMPKMADPSTLEGTSSRAAGAPFTRQSSRSFKLTRPGGVAAAIRASSPYPAERPDAWDTTARSTVSSSAGSFHCKDAAPSKDARAVAAARRTIAAPMPMRERCGRASQPTSSAPVPAVVPSSQARRLTPSAPPRA